MDSIGSRAIFCYNSHMVLAVLLASATMLTNAAQVAEAILHSKKDVPFEVEGVVTLPSRRKFTVGDSSGCVAVRCERLGANPAGITTGDVVRVKGRTIDYDRGIVFAEAATVTRIAHMDVEPATNASISAIMSGGIDYRAVRTTGTLREVFRDEIEPGAIYMALSEGGQTIYLTLVTTAKKVPGILDRLRRLIGVHVAVMGICTPFNQGYRRLLGRSVMLRGLDSITPLESEVKRSTVPEIDDIAHINPTDLSKMRLRRARGHVIAVSSDGCFYIRDAKQEIRRIRPVECRLPRYGDGVEVVGFPETDLYRINLSCATWSPVELPRQDGAPPEQIRADLLVTDGEGHPKIDVERHGRLVRIAGAAADGFSPESGARTFGITENGHTIEIDVTSAGHDAPSVPAGSRVEVTGVAIARTETWNPYSVFPHATGMFVAVRRPGDVRIISPPPWWTPARMAAAIAALVAMLVGVMIWNRALNRVAERRSRQLLREKSARADATLRFDERTRLAVELHDALSQTLTGLSFQIDAAERAREKEPSLVARHLSIARKTLQHCREEVRNCISDLRGLDLEQKTVASALRKALHPYEETARLSIDCRVPRRRMSDSTLHATLCIVREAVSNAIRHGRATEIRIAGGEEDGKPVFRVTDNGCGFDPARCPGMADGHFGILGMRERAKRMDAAIKIRSRPGEGAEVTLSLASRQTNEEDTHTDS